MVKKKFFYKNKNFENLQFVIDKKLGQHEQEPETVDTVDKWLQDPAVPALVGDVE